ncbi:MAG: ABC transporter permease [Vicinamibacterales bacterium]
MTDIRHAFRSLGRTPGFTALAVLTLAVGIGGTAAVFSVVNGVLLQPLPYPDASRIVMISDANARTRTMGVSNPDFLDWHAQATTFSAMAGWEGGRETVLGGRQPVTTGSYLVTRDFFDVFAVRPALGRTFSPEETQANGRPAAVVGYGFWQRVLGSEPDLSNLTIRVGGLVAPVVGVMPPGFEYPESAEVWVPKELVPDGSGRTAHNMRVVARLGDGRTLAEAQAEMSAIAGRLEAEYGADHDGTDAAVVTLQDRIVGPSRPLLLVLLGAVLLVLVGACINVASMLVTRGIARRRELAVRVALGAERRALVRLLVAENAVLGLAAAALGLLLSVGLVRAFVLLAPAGLPRVEAVGVDLTVVLFVVALAVVTPLVFGLLPALQVSRPDIREALVESGRGGAAGGRTRTRQALVALEVALALVMLAGAGLLIRSFTRLATVDPGFEPVGVVTMETTVPAERYPEPAQAARFYDTLLERVSGLPGVASAGLINTPPLSGNDANGGFMYEGQDWDAIKANWTAQSASYRVVSGSYFDAMAIPIVRGRAFEARDAAGAEPVAVINQTMARRYFADRDPLGQRIRFAGMDRENPWLTIVGVAGDVRHRLASDAVPEVYVHFPQLPTRTQYFVTTVARVAPGATTDQVAPRMAEAVRAIDSEVPAELSTMTALVERSVADRRFAVLLLSLFGVMALALAAVGIYGVLAQTVVARTPEIGVRMALGAEPSSVVGLILRGAAVSVAVGAAAGLATAAALTRFLSSLLYEVTPTDPLTYGAALAVLAAAALLAALVPAVRATRIDPVAAIRE